MRLGQTLPVVTSFWVTLARRTHPFPSRTRQLSSSAPMVLHGQLCGRVGSRPVNFSEASLTGRTKPPLTREAFSFMLDPHSVADLARHFHDPSDGQALKSIELIL